MTPEPTPPILLFEEGGIRHRRPPTQHTDVNGEAHSSDSASTGVKALPFAGRIGGNLTLVDSSEAHKTPDATQLRNWRQVVDIPGFTQPIYLKAATIECIG